MLKKSQNNNFPPCYSIHNLNMNNTPADRNSYQFLRNDPGAGSKYSDPCDPSVRTYNFNSFSRQHPSFKASEHDFAQKYEQFKDEIAAGLINVNGPIEATEFPSKAEALVAMFCRNMGLVTQRQEIKYFGRSDVTPSKTDMSIIANVLEINPNNPESPFIIRPQILIPFEIWGAGVGGEKSDSRKLFTEIQTSHWGQLKELEQNRFNAFAKKDSLIITAGKFDSKKYLFKRALKEVLGFYLFHKVGARVIGIEQQHINTKGARYLAELLNQNLVIFTPMDPSVKCLATELIQKFNIKYDELTHTAGGEIFEKFVSTYENMLLSGTKHIQGLIERGELDDVEKINNLVGKKSKMSEYIAQRMINGEDYSKLFTELKETDVELKQYTSDEKIDQMFADTRNYEVSPSLRRILNIDETLDSYRKTAIGYTKIIDVFKSNLESLPDSNGVNQILYQSPNSKNLKIPQVNINISEFVQKSTYVKNIMEHVVKFESEIGKSDTSLDEFKHALDNFYITVNENIPKSKKIITQMIVELITSMNVRLNKIHYQMLLGKCFDASGFKMGMESNNSAPNMYNNDVPELTTQPRAIVNVPGKVKKTLTPAITNQNIDLTKEQPAEQEVPVEAVPMRLKRIRKKIKNVHKKKNSRKRF